MALSSHSKVVKAVDTDFINPVNGDAVCKRSCAQERMVQDLRLVISPWGVGGEGEL